MINHTHHHDHHGHHAHSDFDPTQRAFAWAVALNLVFVVVELVYGFLSNSLALLADAGHNFSDVIGLLMAWGAVVLAKRKPSTRFTYGLRSSTILAALANALLLLVAVGGIVWESVTRLNSPVAVDGYTMIWVALVGVFINTGTALMLQRGSQHDINVRGAFLHMAADAAVSLGVVLAGVAVVWWGWLWLDGVLSLLIAMVILWSTWALFRESITLSLHAVPSHIEAEVVRNYLTQLAGVREVHDLHIWAMSTTEVALTAHLIMPAGHPGDAFLHDVSDGLKERYHIQHATLQIEVGNGSLPCRLAPEDVV